MQKAAAVLLAVLLCACAVKRQPAPECSQLYVLLPGNFIIDLAAGSQVLLDPANQEFALFCSPDDARKALAKAQLPGEWRVYMVDGTPVEIARPHGGFHILTRPAEVTDWLE